MGLTSPNDTVGKFTTMKRCQRDWINNRKSINYSGLVQELIWNVIKETDPDYYQKYYESVQLHPVKKKEIIDEITQKMKPMSNIANIG